MTAYYQDGGHDIRPPLTVAYAAESTDCPLAHRVRVYSSWSIVHSYLLYNFLSMDVFLSADVVSA